MKFSKQIGHISSRCVSCAGAAVSKTHRSQLSIPSSCFTILSTLSIHSCPGIISLYVGGIVRSDVRMLLWCSLSQLILSTLPLQFKVISVRDSVPQYHLAGHRLQLGPLTLYLRSSEHKSNARSTFAPSLIKAFALLIASLIYSRLFSSSSDIASFAILAI